jgi:hypothetical protein
MMNIFGQRVPEIQLREKANNDRAQPVLCIGELEGVRGEM